MSCRCRLRIWTSDTQKSGLLDFLDPISAGWDFSDLISNDRPDKTILNHDLKRFERGINIDERGAGPDPKLHG